MCGIQHECVGAGVLRQVVLTCGKNARCEDDKCVCENPLFTMNDVINGCDGENGIFQTANTNTVWRDKVDMCAELEVS